MHVYARIHACIYIYIYTCIHAEQELDSYMIEKGFDDMCSPLLCHGMACDVLSVYYVMLGSSRCVMAWYVRFWYSVLYCVMLGYSIL